MFTPYIKAVPANTHTALTGLNAILATLELFPNLKEVIADRGYTRFGKDFVRPIHRLGINIVMDYNKDQQKTHDSRGGRPRGQKADTTTQLRNLLSRVAGRKVAHPARIPHRKGPGTVAC